jgi:hypothetical protein
MSKHTTKFERRKNDYYRTPYNPAVPILCGHLLRPVLFIEPFAGDGRFASYLVLHGHRCVAMSDIEPQHPAVEQASYTDYSGQYNAHCFISNPPWPRRHGRGEPVLSIINHLSELAPVWLLLPADFAFNKYFGKVSDRCEKIVAIGRVSWEENGQGGFDNCAWYLFSKDKWRVTEFYGLES